MRTTLILRDDLINQARKLSNIKEKTALVHAGLLALIERYAQHKLALMGGQVKFKTKPRRRRTA